jgi:hypothetical protein
MGEKETLQARQEAARDLTVAPWQAPTPHEKAMRAYLSEALYPASPKSETPSLHLADRPQPVDEPAPPAERKGRLRRRN